MNQQTAAVIIGVGPEKGLGATLSAFFAAKGLHVFIAGRSPDKLAGVARHIRESGGSVTPIVADSTDANDVERLFNKIKQLGFVLDIAIYNVDSNIAAPLMGNRYGNLYPALAAELPCCFSVWESSAGSDVTARERNDYFHRRHGFLAGEAAIHRLRRRQSPGCAPWRKGWLGSFLLRGFMSCIPSLTE